MREFESGLELGHAPVSTATNVNPEYPLRECLKMAEPDRRVPMECVSVRHFRENWNPAWTLARAALGRNDEVGEAVATPH